MPLCVLSNSICLPSVTEVVHVSVCCLIAYMYPASQRLCMSLCVLSNSICLPSVTEVVHASVCVV